MKWCNYHDPEGDRLRAGFVHRGKVFGLPAGLGIPQIDGPAVARLGELPAAELTARAEGSADGWGGIPLERARLGPPVAPLPSFRDFYAFEEHVKTSRGRRGLEMVPEWYELAAFYFSNPAAVLAHEQPLPMPRHGEQLDFELEIGCVIGRAGRDIAVEAADEHIAGYTIINDWSLRDVQRREMAVGLGPAKGKDFATSVGPLLVTPDELADRRVAGGAYDLTMVARINGREVSRGNLETIYHGFGAMIARASEGVELRPGDLLGSGTVGTGCILERGPEAVGGWLGPGDRVELEIERLGTLANPIQ